MHRAWMVLALCAVSIGAWRSSAQTITPNSGIEIDPGGIRIGPCIGSLVQSRWQPVTRIFSGNGVRLPYMATGPNGGAMAVWIAANAAGVPMVYASRYVPPFFAIGQGGWTTAFEVGAAGANTERVRAAVDESGNALIAWDGVVLLGSEVIMTRYYQNGVGFRDAIPIPGGGITRREVSIALAGGQGVAVWTNFDASSIYRSIYHSLLVAPPNVWTPPSRISDWQAGNPRVAMDATRRIVAVWQQAAGGISIGLYGAKYTPTGPWTVPVSLAPIGLGQRALYPDLALRTDGVGIVGWIESGALTGETARVRRIDLSQPLNLGVWTVQPGTPTDLLSGLKVAIDGGTNVGAAFLSRPPGGVNNVYARVLTAANALDPLPPATADLLETRTEPPSQMWTGMDSRGNGITGWVQSDGQAPSVFANFLNHVPASNGCPATWSYGSAMLIETLTDPVSEHSGSMSPTGRAVFLWTTGNAAGANSVYARVLN